MKSYNELLDLDTDIGIAYNFPPMSPIANMALINKALSIFGNTGLYLLIGRVEAAGNSLTETTFFIQSMQELFKINPQKITDFQEELLANIDRIDLNEVSGVPKKLIPENLLQFNEFMYQPGILDGRRKKSGGVITETEAKAMPTVLVYRLTIAALSEYVSPFVGMLMSSDISVKIQGILTGFLGSTPQTSTGSSGDQSAQGSSPQEVKGAKPAKSRSGIFSKR